MDLNVKHRIRKSTILTTVKLVISGWKVNVTIQPVNIVLIDPKLRKKKMTEKKIKVTFAPGAFDNFDGTQEELDSLMAQIQAMVIDGSIFEKSVALEDLEEDEIAELQDLIPSGPRSLQ